MILYENRTEDYHAFEFFEFDCLPHLHHNIELFVCIEGAVDVCCNFHHRTLNRGDMMIAFPNDIHSYYESEGYGIVIIVNPQVIPLLAEKFQNRRYENFCAGGENSDLYISLCRKFHSECNKARSREIMTGYLYVLFGTVMKTLPFSEEKLRSGDDTFVAIMEYLSEHYTEPISLKLLSKRFGIDSCYLSRMFTDRISYGFLKYLHHLRIEHAKNLLCGSDMNIYDIIEKSGFSDQTTFNRVFRDIVGMTPAQYRNSDKHEKK